MLVACLRNWNPWMKEADMSLLRMRLPTALICLFLMVGFAPIGVQAADPASDKSGNLYVLIKNLNVPILQEGKAKGTLLFNFLVEFTDINDRPLISKYGPKIKGEFFVELYKMAATLKEDEKVKLGKLKSILTVVARNIVGEKKIKGVFVKDYRRIDSR